eukprot:Polyplicarium_translucidae@DN920_c0_g1_i2.p1
MKRRRPRAERFSSTAAPHGVEKDNDLVKWVVGFAFLALVGSSIFLWVTMKADTDGTRPGKASPPVQLMTYQRGAIVRRPHLHERADGESNNSRHFDVNRLPFTQGLFFMSDGRDDSTAFESAGLYNGSVFREFDLRSGRTLRSHALPPGDFAEGACESQGVIFVLTWLEGKMLIMRETPGGFTVVREVPTPFLEARHSTQL